MQYEKNQVSASDLKNSFSNLGVSEDTKKEINKILKLDTLEKSGKSVVTVGQAFTSDDLKNTFNPLDLSQQLGQAKNAQAVLLDIGADSGKTVVLDLPKTNAKTFVFDSAANLSAEFKASGSVVISGSGSDELTITGSKNVVEAGAGDDTITTAGGNDTINGGDGNDVLSSGAGNDSVSGGTGNDNIDGGDGNDTLDGGAGNDTLIGGNGNDKIDAGAGDDVLNGGNGNDTLTAGDGNDALSGGAGNDKLYGDAGNDTLVGGDGNDTLEGGSGSDILKGGSGTDTYVWGSDAVQAGETDHLFDGKGSKLVINFEGLKVNDQIITDLNKGIVHVGDTIDANNNIAFTQVDGKNMLQIDTDGLTDINGHYTADFQIEIVGTVKGVDFNAKTDTFTLI